MVFCGYPLGPSSYTAIDVIIIHRTPIYTRIHICIHGNGRHSESIVKMYVYIQAAR